MDTDSNTTPGATADTVRPSATVTLADSILSIGKPTTTVTFAFSERVTGFTADDIDLKNAKGTLSPLIAVDDRTWTATFTSTIDVDGGFIGTNTISVDLSGVTDAANHTGQGRATSDPYSVDTTRPTLLSLRISGDTGPDPTLHPGESATVFFIFSEPVWTFNPEGVKVPGGKVTVSDLYRNSSAHASLWTARLTVSEDSSTLTHIRPTVNLAHATDLAGNAGEGTVSTGDIYDDYPERPKLRDATVKASQLILTYYDYALSSLDKDHPAPKEAFTVHVDEGTNVVTNVAVDPVAMTVTLTLSSPVTAGQKVTLDYADPTSSDDANAIQDVTGNDALSVQGRSVTNGTPNTSPPTTSPPSPHPRVSDTDKDSLPNAVEDQAPGLPGPDGAAPVAGDGNGDGVQDSEQLAVGSISVVLSPTGASKPGDAPTTFVTLVDDSQGGKTDSESNAQITSLEQKDAPGQLPPGMEMPIGQVCFETALVATGSSSSSSSSETFSLYVDPALGVNGHWAQDSSGVWANLASAPYGGKMVTEGDRLRLDFRITDGGAFDADGKVDASITASGAPAHMPLSIAGQAPDEGHDGFWF
ncbi:hypothetical protein D8B23_08620 [Verminephrobacter aporrectodeae subsp. tuberculatae]|uniref:Ig-like domain-containing protein n=1 Tax=Verminephrobacter aporrectodeae TaxID=1110389 RepID=UPI002244825B|nr:Ig-like domain-containing protein [Verminephrobacter aporrectodeae]MCW8198482.1 hypothetical protein [Verminephrobacter aporrectodeae subsp. tuberculatae]